MKVTMLHLGCTPSQRTSDLEASQFWGGIKLVFGPHWLISISWLNLLGRFLREKIARPSMKKMMMLMMIMMILKIIMENMGLNHGLTSTRTPMSFHFPLPPFGASILWLLGCLMPWNFDQPNPSIHPSINFGNFPSNRSNQTCCQAANWTRQFLGNWSQDVTLVNPSGK